MRGPRGLLALVMAAVVSAAVVVAAPRVVGEATTDSASLPALPAPAFSIPPPRVLVESRPAALWTVVVRNVAARTAPSSGAPQRTFLRTVTPEGTANVVLVLAKRNDSSGALWIRIAMPGLPGRGSGWVPRHALGAYHLVHTRLVVDVERQTARLFRDGMLVFEAPVGVGAPAFPTPRGEFYVRSKLDRLSSPFYGPLAFGTSALSVAATDWPGGGVVGIHGTDRPELLPGRVSHGCIRLRNEDITRLARLLQVGTPLTIR